jgi:hypothetical protein
MIHLVIPQLWHIYCNDRVFNISLFKGELQRMIELNEEYYFRVHYHIKKALAKEKQLEFLWQQSWGKEILFQFLKKI